MKNIKINTAKTTVFTQKIFEFFVNAGLTEVSPYPKFESAARDFIKIESVQPIDLEDISFYDIEMYQEGFDEGELLNVMIALNCFYSTIKNTVLNIKVKKAKITGIRLSSSPTKEQYQFSGHNELNIRRSETSYAWRFQHVS